MTETLLQLPETEITSIDLFPSEGPAIKVGIFGDEKGDFAVIARGINDLSDAMWELFYFGSDFHEAVAIAKEVVEGTLAQTNDAGQPIYLTTGSLDLASVLESMRNRILLQSRDNLDRARSARQKRIFDRMKYFAVQNIWQK